MENQDLDIATATGSANDAQVITQDDVAVINAADLAPGQTMEEAEAAAKAASDAKTAEAHREQLTRNVAGAEAKVEKQQAHLAAAEQSLEDAKAALAALGE